jgi:hypothetical protein
MQEERGTGALRFGVEAKAPVRQRGWSRQNIMA